MCARRAPRVRRRAATTRRSQCGSSSSALRSRKRTGRCCSGLAGSALPDRRRARGVDRDSLQDALGPDRSHRDEHQTDPVKCLGEVVRIVQARSTDMQPVGFAEGATRFIGVANERGDRIAAREKAADDLAADVAGGADHCGGHRVMLGVRAIGRARGDPGALAGRFIGAPGRRVSSRASRVTARCAPRHGRSTRAGRSSTRSPWTRRGSCRSAWPRTARDLPIGTG